MLNRWYADLAWLGGDAPQPSVLIETEGATISAVTPGIPAPADAVHLPGLTLPGLANVHSHAFHRALRSRSESERGSFWSWRHQMYRVAERLDPDSYYLLARAVYAEMALAGITCVGEFHYVHHGPGGQPYADRNAMGHALLAAASDAGLRMTLLDVCYLTGGFGEPVQGAQLRFSDGSADAWVERASELSPTSIARIGAAVHSVRAVPAAMLGRVAELTRARGGPLHFHLSEQQAENDGCAAAYGCTPTQLLAEHGLLGSGSTAVHATHLTGEDIDVLGKSATAVCLCPTTERDLADGIGPGGRLSRTGSALTVGSDSQAVVDLLEEVRAVELHERLVTQIRGHWTAPELLAMATGNGHAALGWPEAGRLEPGALADFVSVDLSSVRTSGADAASALQAAVFAATAADVREVVIGGRRIVQSGRHLLIDDVADALRTAIRAAVGP